MGESEILKILEFAQKNDSLNLANSGLKQLPAEIGLLTNLRKLVLDGNELRELPEDISNLTALEEISINANKLTELPEQLGELTRLKSVSIQDNRISSLPETFRNLSRLETLRLSGNALPLPMESLHLSAHETLEYVLNHQETRLINEVKLMVLGEAGSGKTSLIRRLVETTYSNDEPATEEVQIHRWPVQINQARVQLNVWDFARDEIEYGVYRMFTCPQAVYIVVVDAAGEPDSPALERFLDNTRKYGEDPPTIVVLSRTDEGNVEIDRNELRRRYPMIRAFVNVSARLNIGVGELRDVVKQAVEPLQSLHEKWPPGCLNAKTRFEIKKAEYISSREFDLICENSGVAPQDRREFLHRLNLLGTVTNFPDDYRLQGFMVLRASWLSAAAKKILEGRSGKTEKIVLDSTEMDEMLAASNYPAHLQLFILNAMRHFELCFELQQRGEIAFLIPSWLPHEGAEFGVGQGDGLAFHYHYLVMPENIIPQLVSSIQPLRAMGKVWRNGVLLGNENNRALITREESNRRICISVYGRVTTRRDFLSQIRHVFEQIHHTVGRVDVQERIPLSGDPSVFIDYDHLLKLEEKGIASFLPEGAEEVVYVRDLLNGVVSREEIQPVLEPQAEVPSESGASRDALKKQLYLLNEKIEQLWTRFSTEKNRPGRDELERQIQGAEASRDKILEQLEENDSSQQSSVSAPS